MLHFDGQAARLAEPDGFMDPFLQAGQELYDDFRAVEINRFAGRLSWRDSVLALGCGAATEARAFATHKLRYTGIDISGDILRCAKRQLQAPAMARMTMRQLGFADNSFDATWAFDSLSHVPERDVCEVLAEVSRVTRPGGLASFTVYRSSGDDSPSAAFVQNWQPGSFEEALLDANFDIIGRDYDSGGFDQFSTFLARPIK
jgi:ubiquinone/menaquinone biosynthesis C-methylase UbiE